MSKTHSARLLDRFAAEDGRLTIRAQSDNGHCFDVTVLPQDRDAAASLWGGNYLSYVYRGGRAFFEPRANYEID